MKNIDKANFFWCLAITLLHCTIFKIFASEGVPPPLEPIDAKQHVLLHPEDIKYEKDLEPFFFLDCPVTGKIPYHSWPKKYVLAIPGGRCWIADTRNPTVMTQDNFVLVDASYEYARLSPKDLSIFRKPFLKSPKFIDGSVAVLASHGSWNYYHWMIDVIPKLGLIEDSDIKPDYYYLYCSGNPFEKETLAILGIDDEKIICAKENQHIQAKTLIVPSMLSLPETECFIDLAGPLWSFEFLRRKILQDEAPAQSQRIYISRGNSFWRKVVNDKEVCRFLAKFGFICVRLEEMSVIDQAKLFASAEIVIAAHGAGLTNLVFCSPGTQVIELIPSSGVECESCAPYFWCISQQLQLAHDFLICDNLHLSNIEIERKQMFVDLSKLHQAISALLDQDETVEDVNQIESFAHTRARFYVGWIPPH